jgi:diaminopimelate decarboxylase
MDLFTYIDGALHCEKIPAEQLAGQFGTPVYVYSRGTLLEHYRRIATAFAELDPLICYSVKCCANVNICRELAAAGSGFDVVSGGELFRALRAGAEPSKIVFAGVGKTDAEIREGMAAGIGLFNVESESELNQMGRIATETGRDLRLALRVNPDVDPHTHQYTTTGKKETKFGVDIERAFDLFARFGTHKHARLCGIHMHIGSPVNDPAAYVQSVERGVQLIEQLRSAGHAIDTFDVGGGFGAFYQGSEAPAAAEYAESIVPLLRGRGLRIILEPGRSIAANAGILLTRVLHVKESGRRRFVIVDASMNELIRPALYSAYHFIWPIAAHSHVPEGRGVRQPFEDLRVCDVVGPVCESGDFLAKERALPEVRRGDLLAIFTTGAYAMAMASQYNSRPRAAEVLVNGSEAHLIRRRETYADLVAAECAPA